MSKPKKQCSKCRDRKDLSQFWKNKASPDGYDWKCKKCSREPARVRVSGRRFRARLREEVIKHYGGKCRCCRERMIEFLTVVGRSPRWLKEHGLPEGYHVLCHNCEEAVERYGYCPHQPAI